MQDATLRRPAPFIESLPLLHYGILSEISSKRVLINAFAIEMTCEVTERTIKADKSSQVMWVPAHTQLYSQGGPVTSVVCLKETR